MLTWFSSMASLKLQTSLIRFDWYSWSVAYYMNIWAGCPSLWQKILMVDTKVSKYSVSCPIDWTPKQSRVKCDWRIYALAPTINYWTCGTRITVPFHFCSYQYNHRCVWRQMTFLNFILVHCWIYWGFQRENNCFFETHRFKICYSSEESNHPTSAAAYKTLLNLFITMDKNTRAKANSLFSANLGKVNHINRRWLRLRYVCQDERVLLRNFRKKISKNDVS